MGRRRKDEGLLSWKKEGGSRIGEEVVRKMKFD